MSDGDASGRVDGRRDRLFRDRADAGRRLAGALSFLRGRHPLVLAIPRGGVPIGRAVADGLDAELDVVWVRKIGAPGHPEYAIGAVDENGALQMSPDAVLAGADARYIQEETARQMARIRAYRERYSPRRPIDPAGRVVVVVDDGLATGATMRVALQAVRSRAPARLICAVPVAAPRSLRWASMVADEVVCLSAPEAFYSVGAFYARFPQVSDRDVIDLLQPASAAGGAGSARSG